MAKARARLRYLRMAPRKVRLVGTVLKGLPIVEAEAQLIHHRRRAARPLLKLLRSALENAKSQRLDTAKLVVESLRVDQGPMLKRILPRARGSATPIQKKMSHVTVILAEREDTRPPRFTITVQKKTKLPRAGKPKAKKEKPLAESGARVKKKGPGFFKRFFSRKSGM